MNWNRIALIVLVICLVPISAAAQNTPPTASPSATRAISTADIAAAFRLADENHDGKLNQAEFATLSQAIRDHAVDANGDGYYTLAELTPHSGASRARLIKI